MMSLNSVAKTPAAGLSSSANGVAGARGLPQLTVVKARASGRSSQIPRIQAVSEREKVVERFSQLAGEAAASFRQVAAQTEKAIQGIGSNEALQQQTEATAAELRAQAEQLRLQALQASSKLRGILGKTEAERAELLRKGNQLLNSAAGEIRTQVLTASTSVSGILKEAERKKGLLLEATKGAPEPIRELAQAAVEAHSEEKAKKGAVIHDFCLGISYGGLLVLGGLVWFMITGSINAIRFGVLLGGGILGTAMASMKAWKAGQSCTPYIAVQGGLCYMLFARELSRFTQTQALFPTALVAVSSIAMVAFYVYVIVAGGNPPSRKTVAGGAAY